MGSRGAFLDDRAGPAVGILPAATALRSRVELPNGPREGFSRLAVMPAAAFPLERLVTRVRAHDPVVSRHGRRRQAATALTLLDAPVGPEILFIERTMRPGDRWSGQMALPGGRREDRDPDLETTAARETWEEVGVHLDRAVGRLDDVDTLIGGTVATFVFQLDERPELVVNPAEVATAVWIPVQHLVSPAAADRFRYGGVGSFPAVTFDRFTIWGLTYRILENLAAVVGLRLPTA